MTSKDELSKLSKQDLIDFTFEVMAKVSQVADLLCTLPIPTHKATESEVPPKVEVLPKVETPKVEAPKVEAPVKVKAELGKLALSAAPTDILDSLQVIMAHTTAEASLNPVECHAALVDYKWLPDCGEPLAHIRYTLAAHPELFTRLPGSRAEYYLANKGELKAIKAALLAKDEATKKKGAKKKKASAPLVAQTPVTKLAPQITPTLPKLMKGLASEVTEAASQVRGATPQMTGLASQMTSPLPKPPVAAPPVQDDDDPMAALSGLLDEVPEGLKIASEIVATTTGIQSTNKFQL